jgi:hypothetical protein
MIAHTIGACADEELGEPAGQQMVRGVLESGRLEHVQHAGRRGQVGDALGEVPVGGTVGQHGADLGDDLAEVDVVAEADQPVARDPDVEQRDPPPRTHDTGELLEEAGEVDQVAQCEPARDAVDRCVRHRKPEDVGLHPRRPRPVGGEHAVRKVDRDRGVAGLPQVDAQIAGPGREIEHGRFLR